MTFLYQDGDLYAAAAQRRRILWIFYAVTALFAGGFVALTVCYTQLPYGDPNGGWMTALTCILAAVYVLFAFPYLGIPFKRCNSYYKMLKGVSSGRKENFAAPFAGIEDWTVWDGVDVNVATFEVKNIKREEVMLRHIYVDGERDFPPFEEGKSARLITQGNLLLAYELLEEEKETDGVEQ